MKTPIDTVQHKIFAGSNFFRFLRFFQRLQTKYSQTYIRYTKIQYYEIVSVKSQLVSFIQKQQNTGLLLENTVCNSITRTQ